MDGGTRPDTTQRLAATAQAWGTIKPCLMRVKLVLSHWRRRCCPLCSKVRKSDPSLLRKNHGTRFFISKIVAAIAWSERGITRMDMAGQYTFHDFAKWRGIKTVDENIIHCSVLGTLWTVPECLCREEDALRARTPDLSQKDSAPFSTSKMNVRDSNYKILATILRAVRDPERTLVEDREFHAWFGASKGAWWRGRVRDLTDDIAMKHTNKIG